MEDELIKIWQSSPEQEQIKFEKSRLMLDLESSLNWLQRSWKNMQLREIIAAIFVIPFFIHRAFVAEQVLVKIGATWVVLSVIYIVYRLIAISKYKPSSVTETYLDYLYKSKDYLLVQKKLLDNVLLWYFMPIAIGVLLILLGKMENNSKSYLVILLLIASGAGVHFLNKWSAKKYFSPRIKKIDELIEVMKEEIHFV